MEHRISREPRFDRELTARLLGECIAAHEAGEDVPNAIPLAIWRQKVERCAFRLSEDVLVKILEADDCGDVTAEQLASALWLKDWLGDSDWDGTGRHSGGTT